MSITTLTPPPTAAFSLLYRGEEVGYQVGVDLVCDPVDGIAQVLVPLGNGVAFRLAFTREQLGALMDELVDLADAAEQQADLVGVSYGGAE